MGVSHSVRMKGSSTDCAKRKCPTSRKYGVAPPRERNSHSLSRHSLVHRQLAFTSLKGFGVKNRKILSRFITKLAMILLFHLVLGT